MGKEARLKAERRKARAQARRRADAAKDVESIILIDASDGDLMLLVDAGQGVFVRRVPQALPLPPSLEPGKGAENATHAAAAIYGLPDFIFKPALRKVGKGVRELGDGILLVDRDAVVIQVKNRSDTTGDPEKEAQWIKKVLSKQCVRPTAAYDNCAVNPRHSSMVVVERLRSMVRTSIGSH